MFDKIRKMKNKKGFTLVELIVVLVILAILAALLVPALTGYIDKANNQKVVATTRSIVVAAQTEVSEKYGVVTSNNGKLKGGSLGELTVTAKNYDGIVPSDIGKLAEVVSGTTPAYKNGITSAIVSYDETGHVTKVVVQQSGRTCTYDASKGTYEVGDTAPVAGGSDSDT